MTESLSEAASPTAIERSPEDQDLLERNTKKTKRGREYTASSSSMPAEDQIKETPTKAEARTPESNQWKTPAETPHNVWATKEPHPQAEEIVPEDDTMDNGSFKSDFPIITVTKAEKERLRRPWRRSLIIRVLGRKVNYSYLQQRLQRMWKLEGVFDLIAISHDYYIAKFESLKDYEFAKFEGPWMILDHYLVVQEWEPNFSPWKNKTRKLLVWVRFPKLPIEYFDEEFLKKIGLSIDRPVKIDTTTSLTSKGNFARICIEIDITKPLLSKFVLNMEEWPIEYEGIHLVCFKCGKYGHRYEQCGLEGPENMESDFNQKTRPIPAATNSNATGQGGSEVRCLDASEPKRPEESDQEAELSEGGSSGRQRTSPTQEGRI
ncbi:uncharacterized protein LOC116023359 [Ipomoea triloba]|uniref:uncharacterized protein LOC116023359 n=1 Tax=Ipomoea triloba TaxID=35885 RepID=UPI00125E8F98|nr:uncharacterized protein LOC116023359 [Ipomoea triloba]